MNDAHAAPLAGTRRPWWLEMELGLLVLLIFAVYFTRIDDLSIRGEEPRRARVAVEMVETGDWVIPRQQGLPFLSRPPLGSWPIAWLGMLRGEIDLLVVRLPSVLATLLTSVLVYGYSRQFLSSTGALAAGVAYATFGQILQLGRLAETEAVFTLLVAASLLVWHAGYVRGWPRSIYFSAGYALSALGALAKGPQAPIYFAASIGVYLLLVRRDWRSLVSLGHLAGIATFAFVLGAWQIPMWRELGTDAVWAVWNGDVKMRFADMSWGTILTHFATYPLEILGCTLPWSVFLLPFVRRSFRTNLGSAAPYVVFLVTCLAVTFPSCWLTPGARGRYYMPLYPCLAVLVGLGVERCAALAREHEWQRLWRWYLAAFAVLMLGAGLAVGTLSLVGTRGATPLVQPAGWAVVYVTLALAAAAVVLVALYRHDTLGVRQAILAVGLFVGLTFTIVVLNEAIVASENTDNAVARLKAELPEGAQLVSLGQVHHMFAYYYRDAIPVIERPPSADALPSDVDYFCINENGAEVVELPFAWEPVTVISCDRRHREQPLERVVIGRRLNAQVETATRPSTTTK